MPLICFKNTNSLLTTYLFTQVILFNTKILFTNSLLYCRFKTTANHPNENSSIIEKQEGNENKSSASINTILKNSFVKENDIPWTGEEDIKTTVLRMIVDKYPPLKLKRNSIKEFTNTRDKNNNSSEKFEANFPPLPLSKLPPTSLPNSPPNSVISNKRSKIVSKNEKLEKIREAKQSRILIAKDAATDYTINKKLCVESKNESQKVVPKSISGWNNLVESRIQEAMAAGEFRNLPYHGKPLPSDPNERNPYLDRTEFFMNRLVQRQGSVPAWIEYQKNVDREISLFRQRMRESWVRYANINNIDSYSRNIPWEKRQFSYYEKAINKLNSRLRSYNTIAPYAVRRGYLNLELEFERIYQDVKQDINDHKVKVLEKDDFSSFDDKMESKDDDNLWKLLAKNIKWWIGK
ncbi:4860_t:CDS:2 [Funneliformis geosporum]|uniref:3852_t:CDS:1 n=1 Tax=Funneliformis geosporum TaxID=1117311 RepID=A0A9W4SCW9_9GLOM|nr:4860_t:CDS:2 [Funneliformis geosporum]CAI2164321.1 3852_t:CDS:2 [Funneliformis geosporum]